MSWAVGIAALLVVAVLLAALYRQSRRAADLQLQLDAAAIELQHLQEACSRLAPAGVVQRLVAGGPGAESETAAERKVVTALFADLVGYTAMSERLEPAVLARVLNGYFQRASDAIHEHRGHVSTFLGDGILAYFGAVQPNPWQCDDAVRAALAMRAAINDYNAELTRENGALTYPPSALAIGSRNFRAARRARSCLLAQSDTEETSKRAHLPRDQGTSLKDGAWRGRIGAKWRRSVVATLSRRRRSAVATSEASTKPISGYSSRSSATRA